MNLLVAYDRWCEGRVKALLRWLEEWLSISQKQAERGMIVIYLCFYLLPDNEQSLNHGQFLWVKICFAAFVGMMMWWMHRRPAALRGRTTLFRETSLLRVLLQVVFGLIILFDFFGPFHHSPHNISVLQIDYVIFLYACDIHSGGERGRRRKLALAELKKMFGTEWMPKPALEPR